MATGPIKQVTNNSGAGYCKMPDGTMIQWGSDGSYASGNSRDTDVTMPLSFVDTNYIIMAMGLYSNDPNVYEVIHIAKTVSASKFTVHQKNPTSNYLQKFRWLTIGRWK